jgi:excisionase family DNA binding protein
MPKWLTTTEAAEYIGGKPGTMEIWRFKGQGPAFHKIGTRVRYTQEDLDEWLATRKRHSTSEENAQRAIEQATRQRSATLLDAMRNGTVD